jgi:dTDP-4-dehydrorhamnose reductase
MNKILITGVSGLLGSNLAFCYKDRYTLLGWYRNNQVEIDGMHTMSCDLDDKAKMGAVIEAFQPEVIIHCAALSRPDYCEAHPAETHQTNVTGTANLLEVIGHTDIKLVYISTDAIFDGEKGHYTEQDPADPPHCYGRSKWEAEQLVLQRKDALIVRINIYGWNIVIDQKSFGEHVISALSSGEGMKGMTDAYCSVLYTFDLARTIEELLERDLSGIYHCVCSDYCSKYDYIFKVAAQFGLDTRTVQACRCEDFGFQVPRAKNLMLDVSKTQKALGHALPTVDESIASFHQDYVDGVPQQMKACMKTFNYG